jgi:hypothetical protein
MGGQGFIPEDGEGALVEGSEEAKELRREHAWEQPGGAAPRAGMQGQEPPGTGHEPPREGGRVQDPKTRNTP